MDALRASWEKTGVIPPALLKQPSVTEDLRFYVESFYFLSAFRTAGFSSLNPLNFADIVQYARLVGYTSDDDVLFFLEVIVAADQTFLEAVRTKQENEKPRKK